MMSLVTRGSGPLDGALHGIVYDSRGARVGEVRHGVIRSLDGQRAGEVVQSRVYDAHGGRVGEVISGHLYDVQGQHRGRVSSDGRVYDSLGQPVGAVRMGQWNRDVAGATALLLLLHAEARLQAA